MARRVFGVGEWAGVVEGVVVVGSSMQRGLAGVVESVVMVGGDGGQVSCRVVVGAGGSSLSDVDGWPRDGKGRNGVD